MARRRLSGQQRARIERQQSQRLQELREAAAQQAVGGHPGQIVARHGQNAAVRDEQGMVWHCLMRANIGDPVCGDRVAWEPIGDGQGLVLAIQPRSSVLERYLTDGRKRALAANIDQMLIVLAPRPEPSGYLLDQYLAAAEIAGLAASVLLNKTDLLSPAELTAFERSLAHYQAIGYPLIETSAKQGGGLEQLRRQIGNGVAVLVGQSGVGKSSLVSALIPDEDIQVGNISHATGLGRHTTSTTTLYELPGGGGLIDSPGVRSFRLGSIQHHELERGFREMRPFLGKCRFRDCAHGEEPGCALIEAVAAGQIHPQRLDNLRHMLAALARGQEL